MGSAGGGAAIGSAVGGVTAVNAVGRAGRELGKRCTGSRRGAG